MQEALAAVRREFGAEAVILHTREKTPSRVWPWSRQASEVEVTAGRDVMNATIESRQINAAAAAILSSHSPLRTTSYDLPLEFTPQAAPAVQPRFESLAASPTALNPVNRLTAATQPKPAAELNLQVQSLQALLSQLTARLEPDRAEIPGELFALYARLIDADVPEETARRLAVRVKRECPQTDWNDHAQVRLLVAGLVESDLRCTGAIRTSPTRRKVVALVGPTGVGKTTTIAKLAANFKLRAGLRVGLVTVDTFRIAAVEQLRTYAEIIEIPLKVVSGPRDMPRVLGELADCDLVLIDTAGRSPADELQLQELKRLLAEGPVDEVHLVLSLAASTRSLLNTARQFASVRTTSLILTKLDESPGLGQLLAALPELPIPVSYLTTGQNVPDDIEPAVASRLARLALGFESLRT